MASRRPMHEHLGHRSDKAGSVSPQGACKATHYPSPFYGLRITRCHSCAVIGRVAATGATSAGAAIAVGSERRVINRTQPAMNKSAMKRSSMKLNEIGRAHV